MPKKKRKERLRGSAMAKYKYTTEQDEWLKENVKSYVWETLAEKFFEKFGEKRISEH